MLDLVNMRQDRVIAVGAGPSGLAINPHRNEVYVVNSAGGTVTVINAETNTVAATIRVKSDPILSTWMRRGIARTSPTQVPTMFRCSTWGFAGKLA